MTQLKSKNILITGGATGIGKEMAKIAIAKGASNLVLWDLDELKLNETVNELKTQSANIYPIVVDVTDTYEIILASDQTRLLVGKIDILINNAGILIGKFFHEHTHNDIHREMTINANGYMHTTREFLPAMIEQRSGHICNIASAAGLLGNPRMSIYCASKSAVIGWSDSLRIEMNQLKTNVRVSIVTPNFINTGLIPGVKSFAVPILKKEDAARNIIRGIERNKVFIRLQSIVYTIPFFKAILPLKMFDYIFGNLLGVYSSMNNFKGNSKK